MHGMIKPSSLTTSELAAIEIEAAVSACVKTFVAIVQEEKKAAKYQRIVDGLDKLQNDALSAPPSIDDVMSFMTRVRDKGWSSDDRVCVIGGRAAELVLPFVERTKTLVRLVSAYPKDVVMRAKKLRRELAAV